MGELTFRLPRKSNIFKVKLEDQRWGGGSALSK